MNILFIEPFYSGSHKSWLDQLVLHSSHNIKRLTMDGKSWKWRMYGASLTMSQKLKEMDWDLDLIIVSDMLDLSTFIALSKDTLHRLGNPKIAVYFHENQLAYPWRPGGDDLKEKRDVHYGMTNYTTALTADYVIFNSNHNRDTFFHELGKLLDKMPDYQHTGSLEKIKGKTSILPIGLEAPTPLTGTDLDDFMAKYGIRHNHPPLILWNHRLDHDKNPKGFLETLIRLKKEGITFTLAFLGQMNHRNLDHYEHLLEELKEETIALGFVSRQDYLGFLTLAPILPVTSYHDFFGISVMEAIAYGAQPILPDRLTYPDLYKIKDNPEIFYTDHSDLQKKLADTIKGSTSSKSYIHLTKPYWWSGLILHYDSFFASLSN